MNSPRNWGFLFYSLALLLVALIGLSTYLTPTLNLTPAQLWLGGKGIIELATGFGTICVAGVAAYFAYQSYRLNLAIGAATRFQKGAELLASPGDAANIGGIWALYDVATEYPKKYMGPFARSMIAFIRSKCQAEIDSHPTSRKRTTPAPPWSVSNRAAVNAVIALGKVPLEQRWSREFTDEDTIHVESLYVSDGGFRNADFRKLGISGVIGAVKFIDCNFAGVEVALRVVTEIYFRNSDLQDAKLSIGNIDGSRVSGSIYDLVKVSECKIDRATINGKALETFLDEANTAIKQREAEEAEFDQLAIDQARDI